jgi:16S rRNA (cytosine1402-N4)-methyltransferase
LSVIPFQHLPVLHEQVLSFLPTSAKTSIDFTLGGAGHAQSVLQQNPELFLIGVDRDPQAIQAAQSRLSQFDGRFRIIHEKFSSAANVLTEEGIKADFILADIGVSSPQLDQDERGFSFRNDGPLDMRMNPNDPTSAEAVINEYSEKELTYIFKVYGEEKFSSRIAKNIVKRREETPFSTTKDLSEVVFQSIPAKFRYQRKSHPATKIFQAIRIEVNQELKELEQLLEASLDLLAPQGRLAIISFHSLEDRMVKRFLRHWENPCTCPHDFPICTCHAVQKIQQLSRKPMIGTPEEIEANPRARSAKLRVGEKIGEE